MKRKQRKPSDDSFTVFVIDQLHALGAVEARSMFGGKGLYWKDQIFGLIDEGRRIRQGTREIDTAGVQARPNDEPWFRAA